MNKIMPVMLLPGRLKTGNQPNLTGSSPMQDDGDSRGRCLSRKRRDRAARCNNDHNPPAHQIGGQRWQSVVPAPCPSEFDGDILALDIAGLFKAVAKCRRLMG